MLTLHHVLLQTACRLPKSACHTVKSRLTSVVSFPVPFYTVSRSVALPLWELTFFFRKQVTFGTSRSMGVLAQLVWDRGLHDSHLRPANAKLTPPFAALTLPLERPKSLSMEAIKKIIKVNLS